jgi:hypothetical protein
MANINEILARAAALRDETALNSISPERAGSIMYDTLMALNELWLQQGSALVISKIYASVAAMQADTDPVSDISGKPLRPGQIVVIASSDSDNGSVYRYNGSSSPSWSLVGVIGNLEPVDSLDSDSTQLPLAAHQGKVLDGKISQLGQKTSNTLEAEGLVNLAIDFVEKSSISATGEFVTANAFYRTGYIPVTPGHLYYFVSTIGTSSNVFLAEYDSSHEYISHIQPNSGSRKEFYTPSNANVAYIAMSSRNGTLCAFIDVTDTILNINKST